jgi:DNA polymerase-4
VRFADRSPRLVPGIGPRTAERLESRGVRTLRELAAVPDDRLSEWFGDRLGPHLGSLARFEDGRALDTARVRKSESRETTFDTDLHGLEALLPVLERLAAQLCEDLQAHERRGRTIGIKVRLDDFSTHTRARTIDHLVNDEAIVCETAAALLRALDPKRPVRLLGVRVAGMDEGRRDRDPAAPRDDQLQLSL